MAKTCHSSPAVARKNVGTEFFQLPSISDVDSKAGHSTGCDYARYASFSRGF